jgi:uncharacterized protein YxjI
MQLKMPAAFMEEGQMMEETTMSDWGGGSAQMAFQYDRYLLKRQVFALTGKIRVYTPDGSLAAYSEQKMFRLREDIRLYADDQKQQELIWIQSRQILDFAAAYDVVDTSQATKIGALRRKGFRSLVRDKWEILDANDVPVGELWEDSAAKALVRRLLLGSLLPQRYDVIIGEQVVAQFAQRFNLLRYELDLDFSADLSKRLDRRLGLAAAVLLGIIEGRQR